MEKIPLFLFVSFITCFTPGAGVLYTISSGFRGGMKLVLASPLGTTVGCAIMAAISATGLGALIASSPTAYVVLQVVSAAVLAWLGRQNWRAGAVDLSAATRLSMDALSFRKIFWSSVTIQATNIMLIVFLLSLMPPFIDPEKAYLPQAVLLSVLFLVVCFCVHLGYSLVAAAGAKYLAGPRFSFWLNRVSALIFWLLAVSVLWSAFTHQGL